MNDAEKLALAIKALNDICMLACDRVYEKDFAHAYHRAEKIADETLTKIEGKE